MATYGSFPGVQVTTQGGAIGGVEVGDEEKLVIFGEGDASAGSASVNDPTQVNASSEADDVFGDSELSQAVRDAIGNGANVEYLYGVIVQENSITAEAFAGSASGTLANAPIVEDLSTITVQDTVDTTEASVEFRYESPPAAPSNADTVFINPLTGEWTADSSSDYEFDYTFQDWQNAFDSADLVVDEGETGVYAALTEAETVASDLASKVNALRSDFKMVNGVSGAEPNATKIEDGTPRAVFDTATYSDAIDSDSYFLLGPVRKNDSTETVIGGAAGLMAGHAIDDPIYNDPLSGFTEIEQKLTSGEATDFEDAQVIPIRQTGSIRITRNLSTSTATDWERDFWRRRIVDRVILLAKQVGDATVGAINDSRTRQTAETTLFAEMSELVNSRLIKPNRDGANNWSVNVYEDSTNADEVNIDVGFTPYGIAKRIDESITVNT